MGANAYDCDCSTGYTFTGGTCAEMVCIFTSVDGVDGWCPAPDFKEIVSPKSASDDAIEHNDAAACWELAQTDPDCVNKDAVSFDHTTGQCLCDKVADCQLGAHGPPTFNRFECSREVCRRDRRLAICYNYMYSIPLTFVLFPFVVPILPVLHTVEVPKTNAPSFYGNHYMYHSIS